MRRLPLLHSQGQAQLEASGKGRGTPLETQARHLVEQAEADVLRRGPERSGSMTLRMASPTLGPTPDTAVSISKQACCSSVANPYRLTSFSVTLITVYRVVSCPTPGSAPATLAGHWV